MVDLPADLKGDKMRMKDEIERAKAEIYGGVRPRIQLFCLDPSLTKQEFKDECDLAMTLDRFKRTPEGREVLRNLPESFGGQFGDFSEIPDYQTAQNAIIKATKSFDALPAMVRTRFGNDAATFMDFCGDANNVPEMRKMGLMTEEKKETTKA